jgi:hypothetical protein
MVRGDGAFAWRLLLSKGMRRHASAFLLVGSLGTFGCDFSAFDGSASVTGAEFRQALDEVVESGQVQQLENGVIEITTDFTIGDGIEQVRQHIADVLAACGSTHVMAMDDVSIFIDFGEASEPCSFKGRNYSGQVELVITRADDSIEVAHTYIDLSNGIHTLNGSQRVAWSGNALEVGSVVERHVVSDLEWHGPRGHVEHQAERTMTFLDWLEGPTQRIRIDGEHQWHREGETWRLDVGEIELRLVDPVPQSGSYALTLPNGKHAELLFERIDEDTIQVTMTGGRRDHVFHVTRSGAVTEA